MHRWSQQEAGSIISQTTTTQYLDCCSVPEVSLYHIDLCGRQAFMPVAATVLNQAYETQQVSKATAHDTPKTTTHIVVPMGVAGSPS